MKWISVKDRLPSEDKPHLVYCPTMNEKLPYIGIAWFSLRKKKWELLPVALLEGITHWMPLPKPPK